MSYLRAKYYKLYTFFFNIIIISLKKSTAEEERFGLPIPSTSLYLKNVLDPSGDACLMFFFWSVVYIREPS